MVVIEFVCDGNLMRSPTFEHFMADRLPKDLPGYEWIIRSSGIAAIESCMRNHTEYCRLLTNERMDNADIIFVMLLHQEQWIRSRNPKAFRKVHVIGIPDIYDQDDPKLIELIEKYWYPLHFLRNWEQWYYGEGRYIKDEP